MIVKPIIFIGFGRSGTTVLFNTFAARPDLAWFSQYLNRMPWLPAVSTLARLADLSPALRRPAAHRRTGGRSDRARALLDDLRVGPSEANLLWRHYCGKRFLNDFLIDVEATDRERRRMRGAVAKALRYQGKPRFATKITGPARIGYLTSIFDDALFVHVVRDGRAVINSLLGVNFWRDSWRLREPAWANGLSDADLRRWDEFGRSPLALAALEWCAVVDRARDEARQIAPGRYAEVRYEDFLAEPHRTLDRIANFCELPRSPEAHDYLDRHVSLRGDDQRWRERFDAEERRMVDELMAESLVAFGYDPR
jgi:hypothetical protein